MRAQAYHHGTTPSPHLPIPPPNTTTTTTPARPPTWKGEACSQGSCHVSSSHMISPKA